jgi:hypothetical protein
VQSKSLNPMTSVVLVLTKEFFQPRNERTQQEMGLLMYFAYCEAPAANNSRDEASLNHLCRAQDSIDGCLNGVSC